MQHTQQHQLELGESRVSAARACWASSSHVEISWEIFRPSYMSRASPKDRIIEEWMDLWYGFRR